MSSTEYRTSTAYVPDNGAAVRVLIEHGAGVGKAKENSAQHGEPYAVVPEGWKLAELPTLDTPRHPKGNLPLRDAASFVRWVNDHKVPETRIYAALDPAKFVAVIDDFTQTLGSDEDPSSQAAWREFRSTFAVPASREWKLWNDANRKPMSQIGFAEFLQDNLPDVISPDGSTLLELALNFEAAQAGSFVATQRLHDGSHNLQWRADNNASGSVKLPEAMLLSIPVFENEALREVQARLRYRVKEGTLAIWYELVRPHKVLEAAFRETWQRIDEGTQVPILLGTPE